jgi:hypothetical protein
MATYRTCCNIDIALRNIILAAVEGQFIASLHNDVTRLKSLTTIAVLNHLTTTYGTITREHMMMNLTLFNSNWSPQTPIGNFNTDATSEFE